MLKGYLSQVIQGRHLSREDARQAMNIIMCGEAKEAQIGAFLAALRMKGETSAEVAGFAETMRSHALSVNCLSTNLIDTCGTGGDEKGIFNVSTTVAFVLAGAGVNVAKHGNRGVSSSCGSADVLTALGVNVELEPAMVAEAIDSIGVGFIYAPSFHSAMKYAAKPRKELGFRTVFNLLGPLTNPAKANCQLIGVYDKGLTIKVAEALIELGVERAMVVHSLDGLDEISTAAPTQVAEVADGKISTYLIDPADYGFSANGLTGYLGGTPEQNSGIVTRILNSEPGPCRDIVLLNAAAALKVAGKAETIEQGLELAKESIDSGAASEKLRQLIRFSQERRERLLS